MCKFRYISGQIQFPSKSNPNWWNLIHSVSLIQSGHLKWSSSFFSFIFSSSNLFRKKKKIRLQTLNIYIVYEKLTHTHLEPDILECEVKWALGSITMNKLSGGDGIPFELFQILKDDAAKVLHSKCQQIWKSQQWSQDWKLVFIPVPKKGNAKECSNYHTTALISHTSKVMLKILQARLQQYVNLDLPDVQAGFRRGKEPEIKLPTSVGSLKKQENFRKTSASTSLTTLKSLIMWFTTNCGKFWNRWEYQTTLPASWEIFMQVKKQQN